MKRVALLFANRTFGNRLARAVEIATEKYVVDVFAGIPVRHRIAVVRRGEYDLLVADEPIGNGPFAVLLARALDVPVALVLRGWADLMNAHGEHGWVQDRSIAARTRCCVRAADALFVLSDVTRERLADRYTVGRALTVGRPIDVPHYASGTARSAADERVALTVTNLRYEAKFEGIRTILEGLAPVFEHNESFRYQVAGAGRYLPALRSFVARYPYSERVEVLGWCEDIPELLSGADLFVYVSYLDSISTAVLEAQAAGLPVVAGDAVGVPTAVGNAGHLCPPVPASVEAAVERVVTDDAYRETLARRATARMNAYNERAARQYVAAWNALIDGGNPSERDLPALDRDFGSSLRSTDAETPARR